MYASKIFRYAFNLIHAVEALLFVPPLSAQLKLKYFACGARFFYRGAQAVL